MKEKLTTWGKKAAKVIGFIVIVFLIFKIIVFGFHFTPNGFRIMDQTDHQLVVKSYTFFGTTDEIYTYKPTTDYSISIAEFKKIIENQKNFYVLLFSAVTISTAYFMRLRRNGKKLFRAIFDSNLFFAIVIPLIPLRNYLIAIEGLLMMVNNK